MSEERFGNILRDGERIGLRFERHFAHAPEKVWKAITESEGLKHWMPCTMIGPREAGARIELVFLPELVERYQLPTPTLPGEIVVWDPPSVFEWMWDTDRLRFELHATDGGTRLEFVTWLSEKGAGSVKTAAGYHVCLDALEELLERGPTEQVHTRSPEALENAYAERFAQR